MNRVEILLLVELLLWRLLKYRLWVCWWRLLLLRHYCKRRLEPQFSQTFTKIFPSSSPRCFFYLVFFFFFSSYFELSPLVHDNSIVPPTGQLCNEVCDVMPDNIILVPVLCCWPDSLERGANCWINVVCVHAKNYIKYLKRRWSSLSCCLKHNLVSESGTGELNNNNKQTTPAITDLGMHMWARCRITAEEWGFQHTSSSPNYPSSNRLAESSVKIVKALMKKNHEGKADFQRSPMIYRSAPLQNGLSPAQMLMGQRIRTNLSIHQERLQEQTKSKPQNKNIKTNKNWITIRKRKTYKSSSLEIKVCILNHVRGTWMQQGCVGKEPVPHPYEIQTERGATRKRNRVDLRPQVRGQKADLQPNDPRGVWHD